MFKKVFNSALWQLVTTTLSSAAIFAILQLGDTRHYGIPIIPKSKNFVNQSYGISLQTLQRKETVTE